MPSPSSCSWRPSVRAASTCTPTTASTRSRRSTPSIWSTARPVSQQQPFNLLLVGSDSRAFVDNSTQVNAFGDEANAGGQRSDVTMVARFDPANKTVTILSIPRDLWVNIPGRRHRYRGMNRINAAFDSGPDLLIRRSRRISASRSTTTCRSTSRGSRAWSTRWAASPWTSPPRSRTPYTGLDVTTTGCQVVNGTTALQLVRSRHLYYMNANGYWERDGLSDFSRIQRQDAFFRAVLAKIGQVGLDPLTINSFIGAAVTNLTIDDTLSKSDLFNLAQDFRGLPSSHLVTETLPTLGYTTSGGADVLKEAQPYAQNMIDAFNQIGTAPASLGQHHDDHQAGPDGQSQGGEHHDDVDHAAPQRGQVNVLNAGTVDGRPTRPAGRSPGWASPSPRSATPRPSSASGPHPRSSTGPRDTPRHRRWPRAERAGHLEGDSSLTGQTVSLLIAGSGLTVTGSSTSGTWGHGGGHHHPHGPDRTRPRRRSRRTSTPTRSRNPGTPSPARSASRPRRRPRPRRRGGMKAKK